MKAYMVYPGNNLDEGCILAFAETRNEARQLGMKCGLWPGYDYVSFKAIRKPKYDKYYKGMAIIERNSELPPGAPEFFVEEA